jgi:hypothetical protein
MSGIFKVDVEFRVESGLLIPEYLNVPLHSKIEWNVVDRNPNASSRRFGRQGLLFNLYFPGDSPFDRKHYLSFLRYPDAPSYGGRAPLLAPVNQMLVSAVTQKVGDFKYGINVVDIERKDMLYDEDPFISVYLH